MKTLEINSQKNVLPNLNLHVIEWKNGLEMDSMPILRNKLQLLYSSMEVQILPMPMRMQLINSPCVTLSMQDLLEKSLNLEKWLQYLVNLSSLKILVSLQNLLRGRAIFLKLEDFTTHSTL